MRSRLTVALVLLCTLLVWCSAAMAAEAGDVQKKAATQAAPAPLAPQAAPAPPAPAGKATDPAVLGERVNALEKENLVLREDLGKARLDTRTAMNDMAKRQAEEMARFQQKIDALNAELAAERDKQSRRNRNTWIALGLLALGVVAAN